jgi:ribonuclease D
MKLFADSITKDEINQLPIIKFEGNVEVIATEERLLEAINILRKESILGFDTETKPSYKKGARNTIALIQISTEKDAFLFRIIDKKIPQAIIDLCKSSDHLKVGVALRDDIKELKRLVKFEHKGFVDLANIANDLKIKNTGLRSLAAIFLKFRISKQAKLTNWENSDLTQAQIIYAATDAWIGREIALHLINKKIVPKIVENI